ncbi:MAG: DNA polymerase IV [Candidatus Uhrbacteria bacterium]|nr:DNA polymerase IV [Candidatus Uhrbacteria bacterium]
MSQIILHIDMNSYFASVEQQANPFLRGKPIGITGKRSERSIVATASIEAKKLGVKTAMSTWEAKKICPSLILITGDPEKYSEITHRFNKLFFEFTPLVQEFSVDESFLDITDQAKDWFGAVCLAQRLRERLKEECGEWITASIGLAPNKLLAKLSSDLVKPNGITLTREEDAITRLDSIKLTDLCGIGSRMGARLNDLGIMNFKKLREFPLEELVDEFDSYGYWLHEAAHGREAFEVSSEEVDPKSIGHSYTLPKDTFDPVLMQRYLLGMCEKVAWRMRRDGFVANAVSICVRYGDFSSNSKQHVFQEATADGFQLFELAWRLVEIVRDKGKPVRLLGISTSHLSHASAPNSLFKKEQKHLSVLSALDKIQSRYGSDAWTRASLLPIVFQERASGLAYDHEL